MTLSEFTFLSRGVGGGQPENGLFHNWKALVHFTPCLTEKLFFIYTSLKGEFWHYLPPRQGILSGERYPVPQIRASQADCTNTDSHGALKSGRECKREA